MWPGLGLKGRALVATPEVTAQLEAIGESVPPFIKVKEGAKKFHELISEAKAANKFGASVYVYDEADYQDMDLYLTETDFRALP